MPLNRYNNTGAKVYRQYHCDNKIQPKPDCSFHGAYYIIKYGGVQCAFFFTLRVIDSRDGTYIYGNIQPILMSYYVERTLGCVGQRRDIRSTEM